jgi:hypothetical protein
VDREKGFCKIGEVCIGKNERKVKIFNLKQIGAEIRG